LKEEGGNDLVMKERRLRIHLVPFWADKPLSSVSSFDLERYKKSRVEQGSKVGTINRELACVSHLFNKAVEWKWIDKRPAVIKRFQEDTGRIVYLTTQQSQRLLDAAKLDFNPQIYPFIYIGLRTGMRKMEILSIRLENIDAQRKTIYIPAAKAGAREQPITHDLANYLDDNMHILSQGSSWLFPSPKSKTGHTVEVRKAFRRVVITAGLNPDEVVRHTLRHTAVSHLVQAGVDLPTVKRISGHKTLIMVEKYAHQSGNHIQSAMDQLEARYTNLSDTITPELHKAEDIGGRQVV